MSCCTVCESGKQSGILLGLELNEAEIDFSVYSCVTQTLQGATIVLNPGEKFKVTFLHIKRPQID